MDGIVTRVSETTVCPERQSRTIGLFFFSRATARGSRTEVLLSRHEDESIEEIEEDSLRQSGSE